MEITDKQIAQLSIIITGLKAMLEDIVKNKPKEESKNVQVQRNYAEEAAKCNTLEELKDWFINKLDKDEKKLCTDDKDKRKKELENSVKTDEPMEKDENHNKIITSINNVTVLNQSETLRNTENIIDIVKVNKLYYIDVFNKHCEKLKINYSYQGLPF